MMTEDRRRAEARTRGPTRGDRAEQIVVLIAGATALLMFVVL